MSKTIIKLKAPIQNGSETIDALEFQPLKAKHMRKIPVNPTVSDLLDIAGKACGQPPSVMDELSSEDAMEVIAFVGKAFGVGLGTGESS